MAVVPIKIRLHPDAIEPTYSHPGDSGFDLRALENITLPPFKAKCIPTGVWMEIPQGYEMQIRPRSGLSTHTLIRLPNSPGTVDSGYRGEITVILENCSLHKLKIKKGDRIAQGVICPVVQAQFITTHDELTITTRGIGGFGSTGIH